MSIYNVLIQPLLQRDFISQLAKRGMSELAKNILGYLDADSLRNAEQVLHIFQISENSKFFLGSFSL